MIAGTQGSAAGLLQAVSNKLLDKPVSGARGLSAGPQMPGPDALDLSPDALAVVAEGMETLRTIREGQEDLLRKDIEFASKRLAQIREQMDFVGALLAGGADPDDKSVRGHIREIGKALKQVGHTLRMMVRGAEQAELLGSIAGTVGEFFNSAAGYQPDDALQSSYRQSLTVEMTSIRITQKTASLSISEGKDGSLTAEMTLEETSFTFQSVNIAYEESQTLAAPKSSPLDDLVAAWASLVDDYLSLADDTPRAGGALVRQLDALSQKLVAGFPQRQTAPGETLDEAA
ncbi:MAG: hypothetical protein EOM26_04020 [Alphaproteobacteria bacterium]|nr:hypothetical protein [Alphaproteobacteria bacterium]